MKKFFILHTLLFLSLISYSQNYHPLIRPNTTWDVLTYDHNTNPLCGYVYGGRHFFEGDTIINNIQYKIIKSHPVISNPPNPFCGPFSVDTSVSGTAAFVREDTINKKVYVYDQSNNVEELLYDFSLSQGDTLHTNYSGWGAILIVDSVGTISLLNGNVRKIFYMNTGEKYIEEIGGSQGLQFPLVMGIGFGYSAGCVKEIGNIIWDWGFISCLPIVDINENEIRNKFNIYPNPSSGNFNIIYLLPHASTGSATGEGIVEIFDINGRMVFSYNLPQWSTLQQISLPQLSKGIYAVKISSDGFSAVRKLVLTD